MNEKIKIKAGATVANVSCGFDCLGYSISEPYDILTIKKLDEPGINITVEGPGKDEIPLLADKNTAGKAIQSLITKLDITNGFSVKILKGIRPGSGIGSSAASAAAAVKGVNHILGNPLSLKELIVHAMAGEVASAGVSHADNVAPSLLGGMTLVRSYDPLDILKIPVPDNLWSSVIQVKYIVKTKDARAILPKNVSLKSAVAQAGNLTGFTIGLINSDFDLISRSMEDLFAEPYRQKLIPGYNLVKKAAIECGAIGCGISGSGPAMFSFSTSKESANKIGSAMVKAFKNVGLISRAYISQIDHKGPEIID